MKKIKKKKKVRQGIQHLPNFKVPLYKIHDKKEKRVILQM